MLYLADVTESLTKEFLFTLNKFGNEFNYSIVGVLKNSDSDILFCSFEGSEKLGHRAFLIDETTIFYDRLKSCIGETNTPHYYLFSKDFIQFIERDNHFTFLHTHEIEQINPPTVIELADQIATI